jgi:hypothetical protein
MQKLLAQMSLAAVATAVGAVGLVMVAATALAAAVSCQAYSRVTSSSTWAPQLPSLLAFCTKGYSRQQTPSRHVQQQ